MSTMAPNDFHGSDIDAVAAFFHVDKESMINFAANVNPLGISQKLRQELSSHLDLISSYPERDYHTLRRAIGEYVGANPEHILVGNGSTELISGIIKSISPKDVVLLSPSYSEYEREVGLCGGVVRYCPYQEPDWQVDVNELLSFCNDSTGLVVICNPNNPTSNALDRNTLEQIIAGCKKRNIIVMVDETYIEFSIHSKDIEAIPLTSRYNNLAVIRGVSKFYAAPGLRLGYAVINNTLLREEVNVSKNPWSINSLASKAAEIMFSDKNYQNETLNLVHSEKEVMTKRLLATGQVEIAPSESNFLFIKLLNPLKTSSECFEVMAKQGFLIRDCSSFPCIENNRYIRICMMKREDNERLTNSLLSYLLQ